MWCTISGSLGLRTALSASGSVLFVSFDFGKNIIFFYGGGGGGGGGEGQGL